MCTAQRAHTCARDDGLVGGMLASTALPVHRHMTPSKVGACVSQSLCNDISSQDKGERILYVSPCMSNTNTYVIPCMAYTIYVTGPYHMFWMCGMSSQAHHSGLCSPQWRCGSLPLVKVSGLVKFTIGNSIYGSRLWNVFLQEASLSHYWGLIWNS